MYHHNPADTPTSQQDEQPVMDAEPVARPIRSISANTTAQQPLIDATITHEAHRANNALDMVLASLNMDKIDTGTFTFHSIEACVNEAVDHYAFAPGEREKVTTAELLDFEFYGSETLLAMVLFNLIKNALYAIKSAGKGDIKISTILAPTFNSLCFTDTGTGVSCDALPKVFDPFFTTKKNGDSGIGLAFCHRVMARFGGCIRCESVSGQFTTFTLEFPMLTNKSDDQKTRGDIASQTRAIDALRPRR